MVSPSKRKRNMMIRIGKALDQKVGNLYKVMAFMNKNARLRGWNQAYEKFNIDHIQPHSEGGPTTYNNLWIVPAEWNRDSLIRTPKIQAAIHEWIQKNGKFCNIIPESILILEQEAVEELCKDLGLLK